ncbi:hypothetical protein ID144_14695 [Pseudomonas sp. JM0905a]|uniref:hypothetical protein n=1 Tax=Pseudomonas sp. JM0905a TaxID=2772484 RepID=UPI001682EDC2|nr:hypothetical protein [Pseudomonas sp. JM0905a]MBD2838294.1 hypothetical protein [Pseudomonas sp. JM0905a]
MKTTHPGNPSASFLGGSVLILSTLLIATGCAQNPDIRSSRDGTSGVTSRANSDYVNCVKDGIRHDAETFTSEENGKTLLFVGSTDPNEASGLVELSDGQGQKQFSVFQRNAWQDKGRLINAAMFCSNS